MGLYSRVFGCNMAEAAEEDFVMYGSLQDFFIRELKPTARAIDERSLLVCVCTRVSVCVCLLESMEMITKTY